MQVVTITSASGRAQARILPEFGFNCFSLTLSSNALSTDVLWAPAGFEAGSERPSAGGIPVLFPFPGRIKNGKFHWEGRDFELPANDRIGNAIHGFVYDRPWTILDQQPHSIKAGFQASQQDPSLLDLWPSDFRIEMEYRFASDDRLQMACLITNPDDKTLPFGFGLHPYFHIPFDDSDPTEYLFQIPVDAKWQLEHLVPTGNRSKLADAARYAQGIPFSDMQFDDVFTIARDRGRTTRKIDVSKIVGHACELVYEFGGFDYCVVYTPGHRQSVCIEPYTCVPNPFQLKTDGIDCGLQVLPPGESCRLEASYRLKSKRDS